MTDDNLYTYNDNTLNRGEKVQSKRNIMMTMKTFMLPRLLLAGAAYQLSEVVARIFMHLRWTEVESRLYGMKSLPEWIHNMTLATGIGEDLALGALCLVLAYVAKAYYGKEDRLPRLKKLLTRTVQVYCVLYVLKWVPVSWMMREQSSMFSVLHLFGCIPVVVMLLMLDDLLSECLVLRDETALTV